MSKRFLATVNGGQRSKFAGLTLETGKDKLGFKLGPAKDPIRFSVGEPGYRSTVWRVWANTNKSDVYIASRMSANIMKISLHESGDWRQQWVNVDHEDVEHYWLNPDQQYSGRILSQWQRPEVGPAGWTQAISILVPGDDLLYLPRDATKPGDLQWIKDPGHQNVVEFRIFLVGPRQGSFNLAPALSGDWDTLAFVNGFRLFSGEVLLIFAATSALDSERIKSLNRQRRIALGQISDGFDLAPDSGPRMALMEVGPDEYRSIWDMALRRSDRPQI